MTDLQKQIEKYLLQRGTWVKASELEEVFGIRERRLRQLGRDPGLVTEFAISLSDKGFKHIELASTLEWIHARNAERRAAFARLRRIKHWTARRSLVTRTTKRPSLEFEKDTGQAVMPEIFSRTPNGEAGSRSEGALIPSNRQMLQASGTLQNKTELLPAISVSKCRI